METKGLISEIQRYSLDDGPGIRTTVFFVGCNLRCKWCANPELISASKKEMIFEIDGKKRVQKVGLEYSVDELVSEIKRDIVFFEESEGGVTLSGGDPLLQYDFVKKLVVKLKENGIKVAVDTAGRIKEDKFIDIIKNVDTVLYDIKHMDAQKHKEGTGVFNELILSNAKLVKVHCDNLVVRLVVIPEFNDSYEELKKRVDFSKEIKADRVDFLRYHELGVGKYKALDIDYTFKSQRNLDEEALQKAYKYAKEIGLNVYIK